ncbi:putative alkaline phosphatase D (APaseD) [Pseudoalteromonas luteoviolacea B = ATCC 29581]|nr:putative alkaline phosphatase D (APaseD) [Pseudoalteromonas luteoviolacea B = ATCC 29581]
MKSILLTAMLMCSFWTMNALAKPIDKILFGSCSHQDKPIPIFDAINKEQADLFIFLGDNIYGDTNDMEVLAKKYQKLGNKPRFQTLIQHTPVIAMWDDHDYGENDAGIAYPHKEASRQIMLDFWQEPKDSLRRTRPDGIYTSYYYGQGNNQIQVILPDLRWNRPSLESIGEFGYYLSSFINNVGPYRPVDNSISMLGEAQWQWLEAELLKPSKIKVIASSLQLLPDFTGWESWANFPYDRNRLLSFIEKHKIGGVILLSGDTHWGEMSRYTLEQGYPLWEITSSSLTQKWKDVSPNKHRVGKAISTVNYGYIDIDWQSTDANIKFGLKDIHGNITLEQQVTLTELQFVKDNTNTHL